MNRDQLPPVLQTVIARVVRVERRRAARQADDARREVLAVLGEAVVKAMGGGVLLKAAAHAPAGGVKVQGVDYKGGQFIPAEVMERATAEEKAAVGGRGQEGGENDEGETGSAGEMPAADPPEAWDSREAIEEFYDNARGKLNNWWYDGGDDDEYAAEDRRLDEEEKDALAAWDDAHPEGEEPEGEEPEGEEPEGEEPEVDEDERAALTEGGWHPAEADDWLDDDRWHHEDPTDTVWEWNKPQAENRARFEGKVSGQAAADAARVADFAAQSARRVFEFTGDDADATAIREYGKDAAAAIEDAAAAYTAAAGDYYDADIAAHLAGERAKEVKSKRLDEYNTPQGPYGIRFDLTPPRKPRTPKKWAELEAGGPPPDAAEFDRRRQKLDDYYRQRSQAIDRIADDDQREIETARLDAWHDRQSDAIERQAEDAEADRDEYAEYKAWKEEADRKFGESVDYLANARKQLQDRKSAAVAAAEEEATRLAAARDGAGRSYRAARTAYADTIRDQVANIRQAVADIAAGFTGRSTKSFAPAALRRAAKAVGLSLQLADLLEGVRRGDPVDRWAYADLLAALEDEWTLERVGKADRSHLVRKVIQNKLGRRQVVWVKPAEGDAGRAVGEDGKVKEPPKTKTREQVIESRSLIAAAVADPNKLNPEQVRALADHIDAITKDEAKGLLRQLGQKVGGDQMAVAQRLVDAIRAGREKGKGVGDALQRAGNKTTGQYGAWGVTAGGGEKPASRDEFPKRGVVAAQPKQPHEMTADEYADANKGKFDTRSESMDRGKAKKEHARIVGERVLNGEDVPAERLAEYPHLDMGKMQAMSADVAAKMDEQKQVKQKLKDARAARQKLTEEIKRGSQEAQAKHDAEALKETLSEYLDKRGLSESGKAKILAAKQGARGYRVDPNTGATVELAGGDSWYMPHYNAVKNALAAGKPVPAEVLADYPDLAAKAGKGTGTNDNARKDTPTPDTPFTGTDAQGREWRDGEMVAKEKDAPKPAPKAANPIQAASAAVKDLKAAGRDTSAVEVALANARGLPAKDDAERRRALGRRLVSALYDAERLGKDDAAAVAREVLAAHAGAEPIGGAVGDTVPFDPLYHDADAGVGKGQPVRVERAGYRIDEGDGREYILGKAKVKAGGDAKPVITARDSAGYEGVGEPQKTRAAAEAVPGAEAVMKNGNVWLAWKKKDGASPPAATPQSAGGGGIDLGDGPSLRDALHAAAASLPDVYGNAADGVTDDWQTHKVFFADLYDAVKDRLPPGTTEDQFKRAVAGHRRHMDISRIDLEESADRRAVAERSRHQGIAGEVNAVAVPGDELKRARAGGKKSPTTGVDKPAGGGSDLDAQFAHFSRDVKPSTRNLAKPGGQLEVDTRDPKIVQRNYTHELAHPVYDNLMYDRGIQNLWKQVAKQAHDSLPDYAKQRGKFAVTGDPAEDFAEAFSVWHSAPVEGLTGINSLPKAYREFMEKHFGPPRSLPLPKTLTGTTIKGSS